MLGFGLVLLSCAFFCIQNVAVRILFTEQTLWGIGATGGFLAPTLHNSYLLLVLRMLLAVPLMGLLATWLYPAIWAEIRGLAARSRRVALGHILVGGGLMFAYLALLYVSIGLIATAIALTLFFTYPIFTALLSWRLLKQRPSGWQWLIMALILVGTTLTIPLQQWSGGGSYWGAILGIASGVAYAGYTINAQKSFDHLHPLTYTWSSFAITLLLSAICLLIWPLDSSLQLEWGPIWIGSLVSGVVTFVGHVLYNLGIKYVGATSAAMIGAANPAMTVVIAWITIQEVLSALQLLGVGIVTASVASLSRAKQ